MTSLQHAPAHAGEPVTTPDGRTAAQVAEEINQTIRYTMWSVFALDPSAHTGGGLGGEADRVAATAEIEALMRSLGPAGGVEGHDLEVRGFYDLSGMRADADLMVWWHASDVEVVQEAYRRLRRTALGRLLRPVWSSVGVHRTAEFNKAHVPAFMAGEEPRKYLNVYPFVRSYEWYLLPESERRTMLRDHGLAARPYPDVRANTVSAFALGDYEWLLAFEADELHRIVDLMRDLRNTEARRHVREELPFFTGRRVELRELVASLP
ncbi:chlorite dismutase [Quadrisphaera granulorum]|uniref:Coproheme decarboxylase n=1 Tax=Quadrisphaera granulorum TaxID=317664 RepID=A0A316A7Q9_9ACTN|nr:hydrogen peroxide-dependent heme synthase [Quadrisphaera granulorum]PWJ53479.1 chlorite dismutase [Quadrisphaera granulorum]SZE96821.1 chlorite dismutase [Quadrisphaera granulorum]